MNIIEVIDEVLSSLGYHIKEVIYWYLRNNFSLRKEDIPRKPDKFMEALTSIYGEGAKVLEGLFVGELCKRYGIEASSFSEAVYKALRKSK